MINELLFLLSFIMLFYGGEFLVKSSIHIALRMKISTLVVGLTVVSLATSSPELYVSIQSAVVQDITDITFGSIIGSYIANITLVLGLTAMVFKINVARSILTVNFPFMFLSSVLLGLIVYMNNSEIDRISGVIFVAVLCVFTFLIISISRRQSIKNASDGVESDSNYPPLYVSVLYMAIGVFLLYFGSIFLVDGVEEIAHHFNISESIISVSLVAIGTSIPELATSLVAAFIRETNLAIGNLIGSNIFNVLAVLGITSIIKPIRLTEESIVSIYDHPLILDYFWMIISTFLLAVILYVSSRHVISRIEGFFLFVFYIFFIVSLI